MNVEKFFAVSEKTLKKEKVTDCQRSLFKGCHESTIWSSQLCSTNLDSTLDQKKPCEENSYCTHESTKKAIRLPGNISGNPEQSHFTDIGSACYFVYV